MRNRNLSVIIIARNEEKKIGDCLTSVSWADEIIVVDTGSTDKTIEIARKHDAHIVYYTKGSFSDWRNAGLKHARGDWVLYVDADERVSSGLRDEISGLIKSNQGSMVSKNAVAYAIPRRNIILGREMRYGGWWPDYVIRLFRKRYLRGYKNDLHEEPVYNGNLGYVKAPFIHVKHDNLTAMMEKTNMWSEIEAKLMFEAHHPSMNVSRFLSAMWREFWLRMIKNRGFMDGIEGMIYALYQVYSKFVSYAKLWELQIKAERTTDN